MEEVNKLKVLVKHWREHNTEHTGTYDSWAEKMRLAGNEKAYQVLKEIGSRSRELDMYFDELEKVLS
jgi:hypothetical protein